MMHRCVSTRCERRLHLRLSSIILLVSLWASVSADYNAIEASSDWLYEDTGTDLGTDWLPANYDDSTWLSGPAPLGYGDGDETTVISFGTDAANKHPTAYFRHSFFVFDTAALAASLQFRVMFDDGVACYLNGVEVLSLNMVADPTFSDLATTSKSKDSDERGFTAVATLERAREGENIVACEVHQGTVGSSDLRFDMILTVLGVDAPSPSSSPPPPSPTSSVSPTISTTPSLTGSISVTPSITPSISVSPLPPSTTNTATATPASASNTPSVTPTLSTTPTASASFGSSPSNTRTASTTRSETSSISKTPSITPTISKTPSITPTISSTPTASPSEGSFEATGCFCSCDNLECCGQVADDVRNRCASAASTGNTDVMLVLGAAGAILVLGGCVTAAIWVSLRRVREKELEEAPREPTQYSKFETSELLQAHAAALSAAMNLQAATRGSSVAPTAADGSSESEASSSDAESDLDSDRGPSTVTTAISTGKRGKHKKSRKKSSGSRSRQSSQVPTSVGAVMPPHGAMPPVPVLPSPTDGAMVLYGSNLDSPTPAVGSPLMGGAGALVGSPGPGVPPQWPALQSTQQQANPLYWQQANSPTQQPLIGSAPPPGRPASRRVPVVRVKRKVRRAPKKKQGAMFEESDDDDPLGLM